MKPTFVSNEYWGWWAMTPEVTLGGGFSGSLGNIGYGYDGACNCYITDSADVAFNPGDASSDAFELGQGPMSAGIAIEDATGETSSAAIAGAIGVAGEVKYSGDTVNGEISGCLPRRMEIRLPYVISWQVGAGLGFSLGDMASLSIGAAMGERCQ